MLATRKIIFQDLVSTRGKYHFVFISVIFMNFWSCSKLGVSGQHRAIELEPESFIVEK